MGAAFEVYNQLGYGMAEEVYQQSLEIELSSARHSVPVEEPVDGVLQGPARWRPTTNRIYSRSAASSSN